ncbi:hypothetical protein EIN43_09490 [Enterobacter hormaechei]|uniref:Uncharacterized protein n=1 Tax=Enterobacter hormaechei TaxID=158836 RepID=A0A4Y5ZUZ4_9ENTR|nr:hypothetical protein EIN43_09490 [Enterobacter hormaechei]
MALHRTHLRFWIIKFFSFIFFKPDRLAAPVLAVSRNPKLKRLKEFQCFHFEYITNFLLLW